MMTFWIAVKSLPRNAPLTLPVVSLAAASISSSRVVGTSTLAFSNIDLR